MASKTITIFGNKGGVGKTFVSVNLATALALAGHRVLLIDLDMQAGQDMARMLNLAPRHALVDLLSVIEKSEDPEIIKKYVISHSSGMDFLPAVKNARQVGHITPDNIRPIFKKINQIYEYVVIDTGNTFSETLITVLDHSNIIFLYSPFFTHREHIYCCG